MIHLENPTMAPTDPASLRRRLAVFVDAGLLSTIPTPWQIRQGELEMTPYVISTDATSTLGYRGAPLGHPVLRQPLIASQVGFDHFRTGSGLAVGLQPQCRHLELTFHQGMPVFDLQILQTHEGGLDTLRASLEELLEGRTRRARWQNRLARLILANPFDYYRRFLGDDGWIARAERFDYPDPDSEGAAFPAEFYSLVGLLDYCARSFPATRREIGITRLPGHVGRLLGRRFREGKGFGWFAGARTGVTA
jgi:hypothetical protein